MSKGLLKTAGKAAAWSALGSWIGLIAGITSLVVLARILAPEDFGIYGFVLITLALPETIACNSLNESLIQRKDLTKGHSNSVFVLSLGLACLFFLLIALIAPFIASGFGVPELTPYLRVMSIGLFIGAFSAVPAGHLLREMKFRQIATADLSLIHI